MNKLNIGMLRVTCICVCVYSIPYASASTDISHSRHGTTTYSTVSGSMVAGRNLAIANGIDTCTPKRAVLVWEFYDQVDNKEGETIVEGSIINATFKSGETQVNLPLTTVDVFKPKDAPFALYTFVSEELAQLKTLDNGELSVSLDTSSHQGIDSAETFQLSSLDSLIEASKTYCLKESSLVVPMEALTKECLSSVKGKVPKAMCDTPKIQTSVKKINKIFNGLGRAAQLKLNQPNWWESTAAYCGTEDCYIVELGKRLGLLQGVKDSAFEPSHPIPFRSSYYQEVYLTCQENYNPEGEYQFSRMNFAFEPFGPTFYEVYLTKNGVSASSWSWLDWSMVASGKISHSLKKSQVVKRRDVDLSWEIVEEMASTGEFELWNKYSAAEKGAFHGRYEFDADVVKTCLSEHRSIQNGTEVIAAGYDKGLEAYKAGDYKAALAELLPLAEQGSAKAQNYLGFMYQLGKGVLENDKTAVKWYTLAAEQGQASAQYNLGFMYQHGKGVLENDKTAVKWYTLAAEQGDARSQNSLGVRYHNGEGVIENDKTAVKWLTLAAGQGNAIGQYNLGNMYDKGKGVPENDKTAVKWYTLAAEQGYATAQFNLGIMYDNGMGVPENDKTAVKWYTKAAEQGYATAQYNLGFMYDKGKGVPKSDKTAVKWYTKAAEQGYATAQYIIGFMYDNGIGVPENDKTAVKWYTKAAEQGNEQAQSGLELLLSSSVASDLSEDECLTDGDTVTLTGTPSLEVFPGRPEYESIEEGDEEWRYWILTTNKKYTCGYTRSYESGELYRKEGNYSRFQLANYKFPRKVLSDARNKNIRSDKGVVTITGEIMFGHNAHHVTPMVLFDGVLVEEEMVNLADENISFEYESVDVDVLQETDGSNFLTIDKPSRTLTIHQTKEYEWFSTLFNNLQESQSTDHATVKVGVYGGDMTNITSHANTYSKVIDGHKAVVIALDEQAFMMFNEMMKLHLTGLELGYISVYLEHSGKFYNGDFLLPASINRKHEPKDSVLNQQGLPTAWVVNLGNFGNRSNAIRLKEKVVKAGFTAYMVPKDDLFKVFVGPELNRSNAKALQQKLKSMFNVTGSVILYEVGQP